ncbi:MAG: RNA methyltransferase [Lachnospiraceae bacterium]|nr:RNA methyltransferase [Lachnospiraceae bacterium]
MSDIRRVEDLHIPELEFFSERSEVQLRRCNEPAPGCFIAESLRVIGRAVDAGYEAVSLLLEDRHLEDLLLKRIGDVPVWIGTNEQLSGLAGYKLTGGALCLMQRKKLPELSEVLRGARRVVVLEGINNPTNVGAIFRSAAALGAEALLLTPDCSDPLYRRAARVSMGTVFALPWTYFGSERKSDVAALKGEGFCCMAMALGEDSRELGDTAGMSDGRIAVFLGNENDGLCIDTVSSCDMSVKIPMQRGVDSLNVAAASAVAFWELFK